MNSNEPTQRHNELSEMFSKMGDALYKEGMNNKDYVTASVGNIMMAMASTVLSTQETRLLGELTSMISARRVVRRLTNGEDISGPNSSQIFNEIIRKLNERKKDNEDDDNLES
jgi:uncharacterized membrane protein